MANSPIYFLIINRNDPEDIPDNLKILPDITEETIVDAIDHAAARDPFVMVDLEGFAVHFQGMDVVGEAVEQGIGETFRAKRLGPFIKLQIRCDDQ